LYFEIANIINQKKKPTMGCFLLPTRLSAKPIFWKSPGQRQFLTLRTTCEALKTG